MAATNEPSTQTPIVPPLDIPPRLSVDTSRPIPNRYHTVVSVEYAMYDEVRLIKWFSDIQMAWIWINQEVARRDGEEWEITPFLETADQMDIAWRRGFGEQGITVAEDDGYEYIAYYEPTLNYEDVRDRVEHF
jgi:hypothetical protein